MTGTVNALPVVTRVRNGKIKAIHLQVQLSSPRDVRNCRYYPQSGEDTQPLPGDKVIVFESDGELVAVAGYDTIESVRLAGEKEFYSRAPASSTTKLARLILTRGGKIWLGNAPTGKNLRTSLDALATALTTFGTVSAAALSWSQIAAAAGVLATAVTAVKSDIALFLEASQS